MTGDDRSYSQTLKSPSMLTTTKELAKEFGESTSMHGLGRAVGSTFWPKRLAWSFLILAATGVAISNLIVVFQEFLDYTSSTELSVEYQPELEFPAVTLCNLNRVRKSKLPRNMSERLDFNAYFSYDLMAQREELDLYLRKNSDRDLYPLGHDLKKMLIECSFDSLPCTSKNFTFHFNMELGNCFTLNSDSDFNKGIWLTRVIGPTNGLIMELNIEQEEYLPITPSAGAKILIHAPGTMGFPDEAGLQLAPGFSTSIGLKRVEVERTPPPYGDCIDGPSVNKDPAMNMFAGQYDVSYSDTVCKKSCYQLEIFKSCSCCDSGYPCEEESLKRYHKSNVSHFVPYCNTSDPSSSESDCLLKVQDKYFRGILPCIKKCQPACSETNFKQTVSSSKWPNDAFLGNMLTKLENAARVNDPSSADNNGTKNTSISSEYVERNLLRVEVFYEAMNYEKIKSIPAYDWYRLLSDIGGQLGLWMGFSLLTGVEFLELIVDVIVLRCKKAFGKQTETKTSQDPNAVITMTATDYH